MDLKEIILNVFKLGYDALNRIIECGLEANDLQHLIEDDIRELFPVNMLGIRVRFRVKLNSWKEKGNISCPSKTPPSEISFSSTTLSSADIKSELIIGNYTLRFDKRGTSKVWDWFGTVNDENGLELEHIVACKKCYNVMKLHSKSTSNLIKHKCFRTMRDYFDNGIKCDVDLITKKEATRVITTWIVHNCRPFKIIEESSFTKFVEFMIAVGSRYGKHVDIDKLLPHSSQISRNIDNLYNICSENIKLELSEINDMGYALTSDIWTDNYLKTSYVSITMHYIKESTLIRRLIGLKSMDLETYTNDRIRQKVQKALTEFDCDLNNAVTVTKMGTNMLAAFSTYDHIACINHLLHNIIENSIQEVSVLSEMCKKCAKLVKYFKKSGINSDLAVTLKSFSPTRWNTIYYMLNSIENNWNDIENILQEKDQLYRINEIDISLVVAVSKVLKFFEETSKQLRGDTYPTLHLVIPHVYRLKQLCVIINEDYEIIKTWKNHLNCLLEKTVVNNLSIFHKIALFLYPPTKKLNQFSLQEKDIIKNECKRMMDSYADNTFKNESDNSQKIPDETLDLFSAFMETEDLNTNEAVNIEIQSYENFQGSFPSNLDVLKWWYLNRLEYPLLYKLSYKIFAIPATSASSQRIFSLARNLISDKCYYNSEAVNKILFIHSNMDTTELPNLIN